jgi:hypothetical protein
MARRLVLALALSVCAGLSRAQIELEQPAAVGKPVWLKIPLDGVYSYYPFGLVVPVVGGYMGNGCSGKGNPPARLPLHLIYRFDQPGVYEVRFAPNYGKRNPQTGKSVTTAELAWTDWTPIEIQPGSPEARARWLTEMSAHAPTTEKALLSDFLPSIAGIPDRQSLELIEPYLYHPAVSVRRYAAAALTYWPAAEIKAEAARLLQTKGPGPDDLIVRIFRDR